MGTCKLIALVVLVAMAATLVQPARAEAIDPMTAVAIAGVAVAVLIIVAVVVIANVRERERGSAAVPLVLAHDAVDVQGM
jgi:hypothetical protein